MIIILTELCYYFTMQSVNCVIVGDIESCKTSLLLAYISGKNAGKYNKQVVVENHTTNVVVDGEPYSLTICDTSGQEEFGDLRRFSYQFSDVFLICFNISEPITYENVKTIWVPEILKYSPKTPYVLVGTQKHLRDNVKNEYLNDKRVLSFEDGQRLAKEIKAFRYVECSEITEEGLNEAFLQAVCAVLQSRRHKLLSRFNRCLVS